MNLVLHEGIFLRTPAESVLWDKSHHPLGVLSTVLFESRVINPFAKQRTAFLGKKNLSVIFVNFDNLGLLLSLLDTGQNWSMGTGQQHGPREE